MEQERLEPITYERAFLEAWGSLRGMPPENLSKRSGSTLVDGGIEVPFMGSPYLVDVDGEKVTVDGKEAPSFLSVLVLHYLVGCSDALPTGRYLTFREIPGGAMYYPAFKGRAIDRIASEFGEDPGGLLRVVGQMEYRELDMGDCSIEVRPFPRLGLAIIVWQGDDEIPGSANILFDSLAAEILPMEDLSVVGNLVVSKLVKNLRRFSGTAPEVTGRG
jgi:hypothetical protein